MTTEHKDIWYDHMLREIAKAKFDLLNLQINTLHN